MLELLKEMQKKLSELEKKVNRLVRVGIVVAVDGKRALARVQFQDTDRTVSDWLPVLVRFAGRDRTYSMPSEGDQVLCIFLPNAQEVGFIVGQNYTDTPPEQDSKVFAAQLEDGTRVEFNKRSSTFKLLFPDGNHLIYDGKWKFKGNVEVEGYLKASNEIFDWNGEHGSVNELRETYNQHTHDCDSCTTSVPNQQVD